MSNEPLLITDGIGDALAASVNQATHRVTLVAPFLKRKALERLLSGLAVSVELTIVTRWDAAEIAAGVSDLGVFDFVRSRARSRLLLHPHLHAKILLTDDVAAVGSANVSDAALGYSTTPNAEAVVVFRSAPNRLHLFLAKLERESIIATPELRQRFEEAAKGCPPPWNPPHVELFGEPARSPTMFPRFRSPERLYSAYLAIGNFGDADLRASLLDDLSTLNLPDGLDEVAFRLRVGAALLAIPAVAAFDEFVTKPRYFGEMAEWMRSRGLPPDQAQEDRKRYLQTLVRWLRHFLPGRYRLEEPNHSELFGRAEGWSG